jgi:hypothetical protein
VTSKTLIGTDQTPSKIPEISFIKLVYRLITINPNLKETGNLLQGALLKARNQNPPVQSYQFLQVQDNFTQKAA